jgi:capsular exopolysaccharide synthesis family protein
MGKTYEAYLKSKGAVENKTFIPPQLNHWQCPNLLDTAEIADLAQKVTIDSQKNNRKVFNFVSCRNGEGTSTITVNLSKFLTKVESHKTVLLIDANINHPVLHLALNTPIGYGLSDFFNHNVKMAEVIHKVENSKIQIIPRGTSSSIDYSTLEQEAFLSFISALKENYSYILIDSSPLLSSSGTLPFSLRADFNFLVVQAHETQWEVVEKTKNMLSEYNCTINGVILNKVKKVIPDWLYKRL